MGSRGAGVRVGMIGAGYITGYHLDGLRMVSGAEVRIISGRTPERAAAVAARYGIAASTADWRNVLVRDDIDAVVITTPDDTHAEIATAAARAGKHIMLQKPMARTADECRQIIAAADAARVQLQVSFMHRYFEEVVQARPLLAAGAIGRPYSMRIRNATPGADWAPWFFSKALVGGVVMQLGVHGIDLLRHLFGEIDSLSAHAALMRTERRLSDGSIVHPDNDDHAFAIYRLASGALATHEMSMSEVQGCDRFTLEIYGERGTMWLRTGRGMLALYAPDHTGKQEWVAPELPRSDPGARHHQAFVDIVRGEAAPDRSGADGLASLLVAEAIYRSQESRREVPVMHAGERG